MSQYVTAPPETDTVHSGLLYHKHKGTFSSSYYPYTAFLLHESTRGDKRIELHSENTLSPYATAPLVVISLVPPVSCSLGTAKKSKSMPPYKFIVMSGSAKHVFRLNSKEESTKWAEMLERATNGPPLEGHTYEFPVKVLNTKHAEVLQLNGCYILKVTDTHVLLYSSNGSLPTRFQCPLEDVTKVHSSLDATKQAILIINTSSTSPIGEGGFAFIAQDAETISNVISHRHNLLEPPLPPRNKTSSPALKTVSEFSSRHLTSSHSLNDMLQSDTSERKSHLSSSSNTSLLPRTPSVDMLDMAPLPPPRPRASLPHDENMPAVRRSFNHSPQHLEHTAFNWSNTHSQSQKVLTSSSSLDHSIPPPLPRSPRPQMPRHAHSVDVSNYSPEVTTRSVNRSPLGPQALCRESADPLQSRLCDHTSPVKKSPSTPPVKKSSTGSPSFSPSTPPVKKSSIGSPVPNGSPTSTKRQPVDRSRPTSSNTDDMPLTSSLKFFPPLPAQPTNASHSHHDNPASGTDDPNTVLSRVDNSELSTSLQEENENDFETPDKWINNKPSPPPSTTSPPPSASTTWMIGKVQEEELYDYTKRGELTLCSARPTDSYLKLVA